ENIKTDLRSLQEEENPFAKTTMRAKKHSSKTGTTTTTDTETTEIPTKVTEVQVKAPTEKMLQRSQYAQ
ncbi:hypothetical protein TELCIR_21205, partial [Teladorsagia circumcincta]